MITQRYLPKLIIYDVTGFDMYEDDNMKYLDLMKPYYHESGIDSIFWDVSPKSRVMMLSNLYRFNTTCLRVVGDYIYPMINYPKGYIPLYKTMDYEPEINEEESKTVDTLKIKYFERFIRLAQCNGVALVCCVSPSYKAPLNDSYYTPIKQICKQYDVPFLYYAAEPDIAYNNLLFQDKTHLNDTGARVYSSHLMAWVRNWFLK